MNVGTNSPTKTAVVHLATTATDGAGIAMRRQHEALRAVGVESRVLTLERAAETRPDWATVPPPRHAGFGRLWAAVTRRLGASARLRRRLALTAGRCRNEHFELFSLPHSVYCPESHPWVTSARIVHLHWVASLVDHPRFFPNLTAPVVWTLHDQHPYLGGFHYDIDRTLAPSLVPLDDTCRRLKADALRRLRMPLAVVGNSDWNTEAARHSGVFPPNTRFSTIHYPLDTTRYRPRDKQVAKAALGLAPDRLVVGFACAGIDNQRKGFADLLGALRRLGDAGESDLQLLSFGRAPGRATPSDGRLQWLHLGFLGSDALKIAAYAAMDVFVIPSRAEAFGQTAIEALACGTSVLGAKVGGIPEAVPECARPLLFTPGDPVDMAARLTQLLGSEALRNEIATAGRKHVVDQHSIHVTAGAYRELYDEIAAISNA